VAPRTAPSCLLAPWAACGSLQNRQQDVSITILGTKKPTLLYFSREMTVAARKHGCNYTTPNTNATGKFFLKVSKITLTFNCDRSHRSCTSWKIFSEVMICKVADFIHLIRQCQINSWLQHLRWGSLEVVTLENIFETFI
jgi:hypothetical protein